MTNPEPSQKSVAEGLMQLLGPDALRFEATIFHFATLLTMDHPEEGLKRYAGGQWEVASVTTEEGSSYWWRLRSVERFRYCNDLNGCEETVDAELLSVAVNLIATSHLCILHFQKGHRRLNEAYGRLHENMLNFALEHLQGNKHRLGQLLAMID